TYLYRYVTICLCPLFSFHDSASSAIYTLSLHDALPISFGFIFEELGELFDFLSFLDHTDREHFGGCSLLNFFAQLPRQLRKSKRSEEHTSELQSRSDLVCRLLLEKKKNMMPSSCS